jgi:hypothetical protein
LKSFSYNFCFQSYNKIVELSKEQWFCIRKSMHTQHTPQGKTELRYTWFWGTAPMTGSRNHHPRAWQDSSGPAPGWCPVQEDLKTEGGCPLCPQATHAHTSKGSGSPLQMSAKDESTCVLWSSDTRTGTPKHKFFSILVWQCQSMPCIAILISTSKTPCSFLLLLILSLQQN